MAVDTSKLTELIQSNYQQPFVDALKKETFVLTRVPWVPGRADIKWKAHYAGNSSAGSYGETDTGVGAGEQSYKTAALDYKLNKVEIQVSGLSQAKSDAGGYAIDVLRDELDRGVIDLKDAINTQLLGAGTANSGKVVTGLLAAIADTGTYAGIDRATYTWWKSYVADNSGTPRNLTKALMRDVKKNVLARGGRVTAIWCGPDLWEAYGNLLEASVRQNPLQLAGGFQALTFDGIPVIEVPDYPAGRMDFIDERLLEYHVLKDFTPVPMAKTTDSTVIWVVHYSQLVCRNPYRMGSLQDVQ